ncbi:MAG: capsular polysaccharide synthesis protein [Eubacterium sp.]|nr:capsular polysaccharide synthesis protein [Eubacterium sp.]
MSRAKKLFEKSRKNHSLVYDTISYGMFKLGYGDINLAGAVSRYKVFTALEKKYKGKIGKTDFKRYEGDAAPKVWVCWLQGFENAPELVNNCVASIKYHIKDKEIVFIDGNNFSEFCDIPDYIIDKWKKGIIGYAHFADIIRLALLTQRGGLWIDATVYLTGALPEYVTEGDFFVLRDGFFNCDLINMGNWLIFSKPNYILLNETLKLLLDYWKEYDYTKHYFIFQMFFRMVSDYYEDEWNSVPYFSQSDQHIFSFEFFNEYDEHRFNQLKELTPIHKLTTKTEGVSFKENSYYSKLDTLYKN